MTHLYERGFCSVLWECGGILAASAIAQGAVQKIMAFIAPKIIGGNHAPTPVGDLGLTSMTQALPLEQVSWRIVGSDCLVEGYLPSVIKLNSIKT
jgi:diaminohydroxyphosphoribosylaminopyrimidine deaminase/5-amino-6-(5-phosphoribosylamino)uracil reductase